MVSMATDLRILQTEDWDETLLKYMEKHKQEILLALKNGYKNETIIWTFSGSLLSAVSLITTLGSFLIFLINQNRKHNFF